MAKVFVCIRVTTYDWSQGGTSSYLSIDIEKIAGTVEVAGKWLNKMRNSAPETFHYWQRNVVYEEWNRGELYIVRFENDYNNSITDVRYYIEEHEIEG
ncbi:MAG: hypothetical protein J6U54_04375 [Clostridiales bacterium]|nr:hypothetical protein [Clostridiales bacterium]